MRDSKELYDMSNFDPSNEFYDDTNKKVLGKFKDECDGKPPSEFVGLQPKMYSLKCGTSEKKTGKGIQRAYLKQNISHDDYRRCLLSDKRQDQQQLASFHTIRSRQHQLGSYEINKMGLCCFDNKRFLVDAVNSFSYGHYKIAELKSQIE